MLAQARNQTYWYSNPTIKGALDFISVQTVTNQASIVFTNIDSTQYLVYEFDIIDYRPRTNATDFYFQLSINGGISYPVNGYKYSSFGTTSAGGSGIHGNSPNAGQINIANGLSNVAPAGLCGNLKFYLSSNHFNRVKFHVDMYDSAPENYSIDGGGAYAGAIAIANACKFVSSSGNMDATIVQFGRKKA